MTKYTIRKPEFLKGSEVAKYFPGSAVTTLITLLIFIACLIAASILTLIITSAAVFQIISEGIDMNDILQLALVVALFAEGLLILFTVIHVKSIEKRPLITIGLLRERPVLKYILGFAAGALLLGFNVAPLFLTQPVFFSGINPVVFLFLAAFIIQSAGEELVFRGYMMSALMRRGGALWALILSSLVFGLVHVFNGYDLLQLLGVTLLGAVLGVYMLREGSVWGAMGLHASWNFLTISLVSVPIGPFELDWAVFTAAVPAQEDTLITIVQFGVLLAALALMLFAGKNRLVVRKTQEQIRLQNALGIAKKALKGDKAALSYAMRVAELAQSSEGKLAALLYHAVSYGASSGYVKQEYGEDMLGSIEAMAVRYGEGPREYWERIAKYPAALSAKDAETMLDEIKRPKSAGDPAVWLSSGLKQCPMIRWGIEAERCRRTAEIVNGSVPVEGEEYIGALNHGVCRRCPARQYMGPAAARTAVEEK